LLQVTRRADAENGIALLREGYDALRAACLLGKQQAMTILFAYDGSESADAAIAAVGSLLHRDDASAVVLTVWKPLTVEALRATRCGGPAPIPHRRH
jgi:hypothetical protein